MAADGVGLAEAPVRARVLGRACGAGEGPTVVVMAGIHGNEPAGLVAAERVLARLERERSLARGELVVITGNLAALRRGVRFVDLDLNRAWTDATVRELARDGPGADAPLEHAELLGILGELRGILARARGPLYFIDLHTCSAEGAPFLTVGDTLRNREFARRFPLPLILGLEEQVDGALLEFLNNVGVVTLGVEAGRHDSASSVERHEAVLWLALAGAGSVAAESVPELASYRALLERASAGIPRAIEVRYRHAIEGDDDFRMEPGFVNFDRVRKGQFLARDKHGYVLAPDSGLLLLPLYQGKGNDGFFLAREVREVWLRVSSVLRRLRLAWVVRLLPGVRRDRADRESLVVDTRIARLYPLEVFHLFGYRKRRQSGSTLVVSRRRHDLAAPRSVALE